MRIQWTVLLLILLTASAAVAAELKGVELPDSVTVGDQELELTGMALRSKFGIKVYVAGLYLPEGGTGEAVLASDTPRRIVNHYLRAVGTSRLCGAWNEGLEANTPEAPDDVKEQFAALCEWMGDAEKGDVFEWSYLPGEGTTMTRNGKDAKTIAGKPFADALFACWIGPNPGPGEKFKQALLGAG